MTEDKQALIDFLNFLVAGSVGQHKQIYEIALATLTALPVKLPGKCKVSDRAHETRMAYAEGLNHGIELARNAIVEAGYQVESE